MTRRWSNVTWKPVVLGLLALALGAGVAACGGGSGGGESTVASASDGSAEEMQPAASTDGGDPKVEVPEETIGILNINGSDPAATTLQDNAEAAIKALGWSSFAVDGGGDPAKLASGLTSIVNRNPDAILLAAVDPAAVTAGLELAHKQGIPVVAYGGAGAPSPYVAAIFKPSDFALGAIGAEYLVAKLHGEGQIAVMTTDGLAFASARVAALKTVLQNYPGIKVVATHQVDYANFQQDATSATLSIMQANPDLDAFFVTVSPYAGAVATGLQQAGGKGDVTVESFYAYGPYLEQLENGEIDAAPGVPIEQSPYLAVNALAQYFAKKTPLDSLSQFENVVPWQYIVLTAENTSLASNPPVNISEYFQQRWAEEFEGIPGAGE